MSRLLASLLLIALLGGCAATTERKEQCTPQWPPGPCAETPARK
jgi:ABC-type uncharacterized transport system auxiliary subunit